MSLKTTTDRRCITSVFAVFTRKSNSFYYTITVFSQVLDLRAVSEVNVGTWRQRRVRTAGRTPLSAPFALFDNGEFLSPHPTEHLYSGLFFTNCPFSYVYSRETVHLEWILVINCLRTERWVSLKVPLNWLTKKWGHI